MIICFVDLQKTFLNGLTLGIVEQFGQVEQLGDELLDVGGRVVGDESPRGRQRVERAVRHVEVVVCNTTSQSKPRNERCSLNFD